MGAIAARTKTRRLGIASQPAEHEAGRRGRVARSGWHRFYEYGACVAVSFSRGGSLCAAMGGGARASHAFFADRRGEVAWAHCAPGGYFGQHDGRLVAPLGDAPN